MNEKIIYYFKEIIDIFVKSSSITNTIKEMFINQKIYLKTIDYEKSMEKRNDNYKIIIFFSTNILHKSLSSNQNLLINQEKEIIFLY